MNDNTDKLLDEVAEDVEGLARQLVKFVLAEQPNPRIALIGLAAAAGLMIGGFAKKDAAQARAYAQRVSEVAEKAVRDRLPDGGRP